ncbi:MAG TPA: hypothetical protein VFS21_20310 [Roseiflexaceae bacterium]|nr:hypothetical protein [Roseiflexaceae bacterium]
MDWRQVAVQLLSKVADLDLTNNDDDYVLGYWMFFGGTACPSEKDAEARKGWLQAQVDARTSVAG